MNKSAPSPGRIFIIAGFSLSCFGLLLFLWLAFGGPIPFQPKGYRVQVPFDDATTLAEQADVRVAGITIGKVVEKELAPGGNRLIATVEIEDRFVPIRRDARAILRQKTLLGETYIEMTAGSKAAPPLQDGDAIPTTSVAATVEFDELLRTFDAETRQDFQRWQQTLAAASAGRAEDINDALGNLPVFTENAQSLVEVLRRRREPLSDLVRNTGVTFNAITRNEAALQDLIVKNTQVFQTLSARRDALAESFQIFPTFLRESRATLRRLGRFSQDTAPLVRDLEPVLRDAQPTLASLRRLSPDLTEFFRALPELIRAGETGLPALANVLRGLDPTLAAAGPFLQQLNPILEMLELYQTQLSDFINVGPSALNAQVTPVPGSKSKGHVLPQLIVTGSQSILMRERARDNRGSSYLPPDAYFGDSYRGTNPFFILPNWDCDDVPGPRRPDPDGSDETPGCFVQDPISAGAPPLRRYPHIEPAGPGGVTRGD